MLNKIDIPCVILSGGKSSRMGADKSLLPFGDYNTLIEYQYHKLSKIFSKVYISSKIDKFDFDFDIIYDTSDIYSPMVALNSILNFLDDEKVFIVTVDNPFLTQKTINKLISTSYDTDIAVAQDDEKLHNLCGVFSKTCLNKISQLLDDNNHKINMLLKNMDSKIVQFENKKEFLNINKKQDYELALKEKM